MGCALLHLSTKKKTWSGTPELLGSLIQTPKSKTVSESETADFISNVSSFRQDCSLSLRDHLI